MKRIQYLLLIALVAVMTSGAAAQEINKVKTIAHRGFWKTEGSAQNSLRALAKADSIGCYASEFDVWLTSDGELVVNHDATFKGVTVQSATEAVCRAVILDNGEHMPTLAEYLRLAGEVKCRHILELKEHKTPEQETQAVEKIVSMVVAAGLQERTDYITFSKHAMKEFVRCAPNARVYYLNGDLTPEELKAAGCAGADYHISVFKKHPDWIERCHQLGMDVNTWTVDKVDDMRWAIEHNIDYITTNQPLQLLELCEQ